jgi:hypothetical protein
MMLMTHQHRMLMMMLMMTPVAVRTCTHMQYALSQVFAMQPATPCQQ